MENAILFGIYAVCVRIEIRNNMNDAAREKNGQQKNKSIIILKTHILVCRCHRGWCWSYEYESKKRNFMVNGVVNTSENVPMPMFAAISFGLSLLFFN